jgi:hypothetical protein
MTRTLEAFFELPMEARCLSVATKLDLYSLAVILVRDTDVGLVCCVGGT